MTKTLKIITTDFGADCDDQKAVSGLVELINVDDAKAVSGLIDTLRENEELAFIISGPQPQLAAQAIGEKYHAKTGRYPLLAAGSQFEGEKKAQDEIFSLTDGQPIVKKKGAAPVLSLEAFQKAIDAEILSGTVDKIEQIVIAPLHSALEYYNPQLRNMLANELFAKHWRAADKMATLQFQRTEDGQCKGNNYQKSAPGVADAFLKQLDEQCVETVFFDGAVAKLPEFLMTVTQETQPGLQKAFESYLSTMQVPWLYMTEPLGITPSAEHMHTGMFTTGAQFPFGVHVCAGTPAGFGAERALKEVCGITKDDPKKFTDAFTPIAAELERFDVAVLKQLRRQHPGITSVSEMRAEMQRGMIAALQSFAVKKGIAGAHEKIESFTGFFKAAQEKKSALNPYNFMPEFVKELYSQNPLMQDITAIATAEAANGHTQTLAGILAAHGARAIVYDAVAIAGADTVRNNQALKLYFNEIAARGNGSIINITAAKMEKLKEQDPRNYAVFTGGVRRVLTVDGAKLAQPLARLKTNKPV